jgi:hypothetical protein
MQCSGGGFLVEEAGEDHDGQVGEPLRECGDRLKLFGVGKRQVDQRHVGAVAVQPCGCLAEGTGDVQLAVQVAVCDGVAAQQHVVGVVLDEQHPQLRCAGSGRGVHLDGLSGLRHRRCLAVAVRR